MAVSPIAPAALPVQPVEAQPAPPPDAAVMVTPAGDAQKGAGTGGSTADGGSSDQSGQQLPLDRALQKINEQMQAWSTQVQFDIDPDTQRVVISIKDTKSGDTIRTIPSETVLNIAKMITKLQGGGVETSA